MVFKKYLIFFIILFLFFCNSKNIERKIDTFQGNIISQRNQNYDFVEGNIIDSKNISVVYLKGDILGDKNLNIYVNVMKGNISANNIKMNILEGNILSGENISVNLLIGEDYTNKANVLKQIKRKN